MKQTQSELLSLHTGTENQNTNNQNSSELVEIEAVTGTPFNIVGNPEYGYFVAIGRFKLSEPRQTKQECRELIHNKDWEIIMGLIGACEMTESTTHVLAFDTDGKPKEIQLPLETVTIKDQLSDYDS